MPDWLKNALFISLLVMLGMFVLWGLFAWLTEKPDIDKKIADDNLHAMLDQPFDD